LILLLHDCGHRTVDLDTSVGMLGAARRKFPEARLVRADAGDPPFAAATFDVVLARHVAWALPSLSTALRRWLVSFLGPLVSDVRVEPLTDSPSSIVDRCVSVVPGWENLGVDATLLDGWLQDYQAARRSAWEAAREKRRLTREEFARARRSDWPPGTRQNSRAFTPPAR
jgi:Methyltransferase domain